MHTASRLAGLLFGSLIFAGSLSAQSSGSGTITGKVTDQTLGLALGGAHVSIQGTKFETYSSPAGDFILTGVPEGNWTLEIGYVGQGEIQKPVSVRSGQTLHVDGVFGDTAVNLERFVVNGYMVGQARAINQQRAANSLTSVVAADEIGNFPDQNAAESLQRVPGLSLYRDQGEGRFIDVRGLNYIYTGVSLNGAKVASPETGDRAIALDVVPSDSLSMVEVTKALTPDMDAEGLGGSINLKTKSPFDATGRQVQFSTQGIYSRLTGDLGNKSTATFSNLFHDDTIGVIADLSWQQRNFGSQNFEEDGGWVSRSVGSLSAPALANLGFRDYVIERKRYGANVAFEYRPDSSLKLYLRSTYNNFADDEDRHNLYLPFEKGTATALGKDTLTVEKFAGFRRDIRIRKKEQELQALSTGFEKRLDSWVLDGQLAWSKGEERKPKELTVRFIRGDKDSVLRYSFPGTYDVKVEQLGGASISDPASYNKVDRIEVKNSSGDETEANAALNARYDFDSSLPAYLKFGGSYRAKEKKVDENVSRFKAPSSFTFASLVDKVSDYPYGPAVPRMSREKVLLAFDGNRSAFTETVQAVDSVVGDFKSDEDVLAAYVMGSLSFGKSSLLTGLRAERTSFDTNGFDALTKSDGTVVTSPASASRNYSHLLPGLHFRHDFTKKLVARASYTESLMRPAFAETAMYRKISDNDQELETGNPALKALHSRNYDLSLEYYLPSLGVLSASAFAKKVDNFSYVVEIPGGDKAFPGYNLITRQNGSDGDIRGLELAYQQQLRMLPAPFDGLGFLANLTLVDSKATYPTRPGEELPFIGQSDYTGNLALTYDKGPWFLRLALNFRGEHLREDEPIGTDATGDRWIDKHKQLDLSASYKISKNAQAFVEVSNLNNEPFRVYFKGSDGMKRLVQFESYDWSANVGLRFRL